MCAMCPAGELKLVPDDTGLDVKTMRGDSFDGCQGPFLGTSKTAGYADGPANTSLFNQPRGLALWHNASGSPPVIVIADTGNHVIRALSMQDPSLPVSTLAGKSQWPAFQDGTGTTARFFRPTDVLVLRLGGAGADDTGRDVCLIADGQNHAIRVLDLLTRRVTTLAGEAGVDGAVDGAGSEARFAYPVALAARSLSSLEVYIADMYNSRVRRMVLTVSSGADGADGELGLNAQVSSLRLFESNKGEETPLVYPFGLALAPQSEAPALYVSDQLRVLRADLTSLAGSGQGGSHQGDGKSMFNNVSALSLRLHACAAADTPNLAHPLSLLATPAGELVMAEADSGHVHILRRQQVNQSMWSAEAGTLPPVLDASVSSQERALDLAAATGLVRVPLAFGDVLLVADAASHVLRPLFLGDPQSRSDTVQLTQVDCTLDADGELNAVGVAAYPTRNLFDMQARPLPPPQGRGCQRAEGLHL